MFTADSFILQERFILNVIV